MHGGDAKMETRRRRRNGVKAGYGIGREGECPW